MSKIIDLIDSYIDRDPAAKGRIETLITSPGLHSIGIYKLSNFLWSIKLTILARLLSYIGRVLTGIEIHPAAKIGERFFIDHGMGVVIGETAEIGNNCLLYQGVTLGGTGKSHGKRHPTLMENVVVGAGAKVLGSITVGSNTRIGAGSVVVRNVEGNSTVVGVPGRVVHQSGVKVNPLAHSALPDAEANVIKNLMDRIDLLENEILKLQKTLKCLANSESIDISKLGEAQNLKDREIIEFLGDD